MKTALEIVPDDQLTIEQMAKRSAKQRAEYNELSARYQKARKALETLAEIELHEGNCASLEVANIRISYIAKSGLE